MASQSQAPIKSGQGKCSQYPAVNGEPLAPDAHTMATPRRIPFLSHALDRLRFYRIFLCEILLKLSSLCERIRALRKNNLFRCGIVPVTTFAEIPRKHFP